MSTGRFANRQESSRTDIHDNRQSTLTADQCAAGTTGTESIFAEVLADVLRVDNVSVDSHFFDELGADSLVMAKFCARVRKRGDLPSVSMKDIYGHPTIRSLAVALADVVPRPVQPPVSAAIEAATPTSTREYILCAALQALFFLAYSYAAVLAIGAGYQWVTAGSTVLALFLRLVLASNAAFLVVCAVPIIAKWLLIGCWKPQQIRLWSLAYVRFWIVKTLIRSTPATRMFIGTPLYALYLKALGAKIGPGVVILSRRVPVCTDLLTIGAGTVIRKEVIFNGYRAQAGRLETGPVTLGRDTFVGERCVLDINTSLGDGAQLGHASALLPGQAVPAGERWHGSPAQRTDVNYVRVPPARCGTLRRTAYGVAAVFVVLLFYLPLVEGIASLAISAAASVAGALAPTAHADALGALIIEAVILSLVVFIGLALVGLLIMVAVPRLLSPLIKPGTVYPLYGFHDAIHRAIARLGSMKFFNFLFGDSSYIVPYLQWLGYHLRPVVQTGSNFGLEVVHAHPSLCAVGSGTMIADGLILMNDEVSSTSFRVSRVAIGRDNFLGNDVTYPAGGRTGDNVLLGTKVMVPLDGAVREGVGLLGSPPFEIPRTVERDTQFDHLRTGEALRRGLAAKNRYNLRTISLFLFTRWVGVFLFALLYLAAIKLPGPLATAVSGLFFAISLVVTAVFFTLVERWVEALHPVRPTICSIYHADFWSVERLWKLHPIHYLHAFDGTPFKNVLWRLMGVRMGRRVFDDGIHIPEPTLTAIGDDCVLNYRSKIQCHSQEDGTFKCDRTTIGAGCTIGVDALVHYGVTMGNGALLDTDSFLMKGEDVPPGAWWGGNPAREM
ncbi:MAG: peptide synthetase [Acidobacteria bacterium]|nr:MAG: peptide synthetase [Acidobacteriota bacterium]